MSSTEELLDRHLDCFGRGDLDGIVADYSSAMDAGRSAQGVRQWEGRSQE